jgi:hypothetical protein
MKIVQNGIEFFIQEQNTSLFALQNSAIVRVLAPQSTDAARLSNVTCFYIQEIH